MNTDYFSVEEELAALLETKCLVLGTAESCTGGAIASMITRIPGSSAYFAGGIIAYRNAVKENVLGVKAEDLCAYGAVSCPVVEQMALGAMRVLECDCAVATSGIAGPGGGTAGKPVGTVWVAAAYKSRIISRCYHFDKNRTENIRLSAEAALRLLLDLLG